MCGEERVILILPCTVVMTCNSQPDTLGLQTNSSSNYYYYTTTTTNKTTTTTTTYLKLSTITMSFNIL